MSKKEELVRSFDNRTLLSEFSYYDRLNTLEMTEEDMSDFRLLRDEILRRMEVEYETGKQ